VTIAESGELEPRVGSVVTTPEGALTPGGIFTGSGSWVDLLADWYHQHCPPNKFFTWLSDERGWLVFTAWRQHVPVV